jgi:hypothetical protein
MTKFFNAVWKFFDLSVGGVFRFIDRHGISRSVTLWMSVYATADSYLWAKRFAEFSTRPGIEVAAIIAAVLGAVTGLQGWVLKLYIDGRTPTPKSTETSLLA